MLCLHAVTDQEGHPLEDESGMFSCTQWCKIFESRTEGEQHPAHETILEFCTKWTIDKQEFDEMIVTQEESAPGPDGIPYGIYRCAGGLGSSFLNDAYKCVLEGGPTHFAASTTVNDNGLIVRSPDALRPLTLCNCECKIIHHGDLLRPAKVLHWVFHPLRDASLPDK